MRQSLDLKQFAAETGLPLQAFVIEQHRGIADGLVRDWPKPDVGVEKHAAYSFQWYSLAALAAVLGLCFPSASVNKLFLVALVCAAPFVLGTAAYLLGRSTGVT